MVLFTILYGVHSPIKADECYYFRVKNEDSCVGDGGEYSNIVLVPILCEAAQVSGFEFPVTEACKEANVMINALTTNVEDPANITWRWEVASNDGNKEVFAEVTGDMGKTVEYLTPANEGNCEAITYTFYLTAVCPTGAFIPFMIRGGNVKLNQYEVGKTTIYPTLVLDQNYSIQEGNCQQEATLSTECANFAVTGNYQAECDGDRGSTIVSITNALDCDKKMHEISYVCHEVCPVPGCTDQTAMNFNPDANTDGEIHCQYEACTDETAANYTEPSENITHNPNLCVYGNPNSVCDDFTATLTVVNDGNGVQYYNTARIVVTGGMHPYGTPKWEERIGYVKPNIQGGGDGGDLIITVFYSDNATFKVTITDANGCIAVITEDELSGGTPGTLDIIPVKITPQSNAHHFDGAIDISISGGCPPYAYGWAGVEGTLATTQDIVGLTSGYYVVAVQDACGTTVTAQYYVPSTGGGGIRGKNTSLQPAHLTTYPNPFTQQTTIAFNTPQPEQVQVAVYDLAGHQIAILYNDHIAAQQSIELNFDAGTLSNGIYLVRLTTASGIQQHQRLVLMR